MRHLLFACLCVVVLSPDVARADSSQWPELFREAVTPAEFHTGFQFESIIEDEKFEEGETLHYVVRQQDEARMIELISLPAEMQEDREKVIKKLKRSRGRDYSITSDFRPTNQLTN